MKEFDAAERLGRSFATAMDEDFDSLPFERQSAYRRVGYVFHESMVRGYEEALLGAAERLDKLIVQPSTPKRWVPGLKEGANALRTAVKMSKLQAEFQIPTYIDPMLDAKDPFGDIEAADRNPYEDQHLNPGYVACGHTAEGGWECTRPAHPDHWLHFDADPDFGDGTVLATWYADGELITLHPDIFQAVNDDDDDR